MTLQSYTNNSEEVVADGANSSINSASTLSTDVYPLPFSAGQKEIVLTNDERALVGEVNTENFITPNTNICVTESSNIDIGNRTVFNRDVTIYQYIQGNNLPEIQNGAVGQDEVECNKTAWKIRTSLIILLIFIGTCLYVVCEPFMTADIFIDTPYNDSTVHEMFLTRTMWGGDNPLHITNTERASLVIIKHTGGKICFDYKSCSKRVKEIQREHMTVRKLVDIEYNFLIGGDGRIYIGRDWYVQNEGWPYTVDLAFIGNFTEKVPTEKMISASQHLITQGSAMGALDFDNFYVVCHNQTEMTDSPGENLFKEVNKWNFYRSGEVEFVER